MILILSAFKSPGFTNTHKPHFQWLVQNNLAKDALAGSEQPGSQASWVTVRMKHNPKQTPQVHRKPVHVSNQYSPLSNTPTEKQLW